jgi:hypothetical protein
MLLLLPLMLFSLYTFCAKDASSSYQTMTFLSMHTSISSVLWIILDNLFVAFNPNITAKAVLFCLFLNEGILLLLLLTIYCYNRCSQWNGKRSRQRSIINIPLKVLVCFYGVNMNLYLASMVNNMSVSFSLSVSVIISLFHAIHKRCPPMLKL